MLVTRICDKIYLLQTYKECNDGIQQNSSFGKYCISLKERSLQMKKMGLVIDFTLGV